MWVRVDDRFPRHPKVLAAGELLQRDGTSRVITCFMCCLCYAAEHLTDGVITQGALGTMRQQVWNPHRVAEAMADAGLFERQENGSFLIHDYHHYNPTSTEIKEKRARDSARKRGGIHQESTGNPERSRARDPVPSRPVPFKKIAPPANFSVSDEIAERAGQFLERYPQIYAEERRGAHFQLKPVLHYQTACELVSGWPDMSRLELMFRTFCKLPSSEKMAWPGTPAQFLHLAPEIDAKLRQAGA